MRFVAFAAVAVVFFCSYLNTCVSFDESSVASLYTSIPIQCKSCGLRFQNRSKLDTHLDWHFIQNKREKEKTKRAISRSWFLENKVRKILNKYCFYN